VMSVDDDSASCGGGVARIMRMSYAQNDETEIQQLMVGERLLL
jgi:hypothetical protein